MNKTMHTPTPWSIPPDNSIGEFYAKEHGIQSVPWRAVMGEGNRVTCLVFATIEGSDEVKAVDKANEDFILRACNSHDAFLGAAQSIVNCAIATAPGDSRSGVVITDKAYSELCDAMDEAEKK